MSFWTEVHWSEGMFLRPHHLQAAQRWMETSVRAGMDSMRPFGWGFLSLQVAHEPLENMTLRLDACTARLKDGTWVHIPDNTEVSPINFEAALDAAERSVDLFLGIPQMQEVRPNAVPLENPEGVDGTPRYAPHPIMKRDENTGQNPQMLYVRRLRGRLFVAGEDMTGHETLRIGSVKRSDRPGAVPKLDPVGAGPLLAIQADSGLSSLISSLADQIQAKGEVLAREAREHAMRLTDGVAANMEHLFKIHVLNETHGHFSALMQSPQLHPYEVFVVLARLIGHLSIFHEDLVPGVLPDYDHDRPGKTFEQLRARLTVLLEGVRAERYDMRVFERKRDNMNRDGMQVTLDRSWIDENLELYVALESTEMDINELEKFIYQNLDVKLASPTRAPRIANIAVRGLRLQIKTVPAGTLPRKQGLHYFKIDKTIGPDRTDYWKECEQERGIRMGMREGQFAAMEKFKPALYVPQKDRK